MRWLSVLASLLALVILPGVTDLSARQALDQPPGQRLLNAVPLALTPSAFIPFVSHTYQDPIRDDFSNTGSGWPTNETNISARGYTDGEYRVLVKQAGWFTRAHSAYQATNFRAEVDARNLASTLGTYGLVFGGSDSVFYYFEVAPNGWFSLMRRDPAGWPPPLISSTPSSAIRTGYQVNRLKVVRQGSLIQLYINGQFVGQVVDSQYSTGYVGVAAAGGQNNFESRFDNFLLVFNTTDTQTQAVGPALLPALKGAQDGVIGEELFLR